MLMPEMLEMPSRSDTAVTALRRILRAAELGSKDLARESGLTTSQLVILQIIGREGKMMPSAISQAATLTQATITTLVSKLEKRGFVTRRKDTEDRRCVWVEITPKGRQALAAAPDSLQERFSRAFGHLDDWEQAMIIAALERVGGLLDAENLDASPILEVGAIDSDKPFEG